MRGDRPGIGIDLVSFNWFTPHARGSTWEPTALQPHVNVYPACAGIDLRQSVMLSNSRRLPRMRGDRPRFSRSFEASDPFTPHARGSTAKKAANCNSGGVYPACAGIDHDRRGHGPGGGGLPRMRGDRPQAIGQIHLTQKFTPHARGSTGDFHAVYALSGVYPACAGIDLLPRSAHRTRSGLPRMRGDRPRHMPPSPPMYRFTPHARGSTSSLVKRALCTSVYPACAGIDPAET